MKIVIPTDDKEGLTGHPAQHFGRCETYTFLDENGKLLEVIDNTSEHMGEKGLPPEVMKENGADILICAGLGGKALSLCKELGIEVYVCQADTVKEMFDKWKQENPAPAGADDACKHEH